VSATRRLDLHEAMVLVMLAKKAKTGKYAWSTSELADVIGAAELFLRRDGTPAKASQVGSRAKRYPALFSEVGRGREKRLILNRLPRMCQKNGKKR